MSDALKAIVVTVADAAMKDIDEIAKQLADCGMAVDRVLRLTGVITGSCSEAQKLALSAVQGVAAVEYDAAVPLTPPGSAVR